MKPRIAQSILLLVVLSLGMLACGSGTLFGPTPTPTQLPPTPTPQPNIKGKIYRSDTNAPIVNATVTLFNPNLDNKDPAFTIAETKVDEKGLYSFNNLEPGEYGLQILEEELSLGSLPCAPGGMTTFDNTGKKLKDIFSYTENGKFYLLELLPGVTVSIGNTTEMDVDMYCSNY